MPNRPGTTIESAFPDDWKTRIGQGKLGYGLDLATTANKKSNPSALVVVEGVGVDYVVRALVRWKTNNPAVTRAMVFRALDLPLDRRGRRLCIDATSERFFATDLHAALVGRIIVDLVIASEATEYLGRKMSFKSYLGNLVVNAANDGHLLLPSAPWVTKDLRQPEGGTFIAEVDEEGNHADGFSALSLAIHALTVGGGPAVAIPSQVGGLSVGAPRRAGVRGPIAPPVGSFPRKLVGV